MFLRFSRYRFKEGNESRGLELLRQQALSLRQAEGCQEVSIAQGQHPSTEFVVLAQFRDESSLRTYEGRMRTDPELGSDFFTLLGLTTQPPEVTWYELR